MVTTVTNLWWKGDGSVLDLVAIVSDLRRNEIGGQEIIRSVQQAEVDPNARQLLKRGVISMVSVCNEVWEKKKA